MKKIRKSIFFIIYTAIIGAITGAIVWGFLKLNSLGAEFLWNYLPAQISFPWYTVVVCTIGGLLVGIWKRKFGDYPESLDKVIARVKKTGRYHYKNISSTFISALAPLILGASVGPEAGLAGIIAGLCTWVSDRLKHFFREIKDLTTIGITAALGTIFNSPLFGFMEPLEGGEEEVKIPKTSKIVLYFVAILSAFGVFALLNHLFGKMGELEGVGGASLDNTNWASVVLLGVIGVLAGYFYFCSHKLIKVFFKPLQKHIIVRCAIGGLALGIIGTLLPLTMFSGESQISTVFDAGAMLGADMLLVIGITKIVLTNVCIESGLKGGHFFPMIFAGVSIGYAFSIILNLDPVVATAILTTAFLANILKKPLATVLLLMIVFPANLIPVMLVAAIFGTVFKTPRRLVA